MTLADQPVLLSANKCKVIAEAGANHNNSVDRAIEMAEKAAAAGAWAIKYQLYKASSIATRTSPKYWSDEIGTKTQYEAYKLSDKLDYVAYRDIAQACSDLGIEFFATPFDNEAVAALEDIGARLYKMASADLTNKPLLREVAATGKLILISTGAATVDEISRAIEWIDLPADRVVPLACTLTYPTPDIDGNFARITGLQQAFPENMIGMSDHTLGVAGGWMAGALGAVVIEKHYTIDKKLPDVPDHAMSVDPEELAELVKAAGRAAILRGSADLKPVESELAARSLARRSVVLVGDRPVGHTLVELDLATKRPGTGIGAEYFDDLIGKVLSRDVGGDVPLQWEDIAR